ncbi:hypothetical protein NKH58_28990, partial [Mesorhizobium australicum]|uniref:hypothetical protein n=1 Tax=Mesorhizobium australicum TaxID=536018 RepID=UPI003336D668
MTAILAQPDHSILEDLRDHALLSFLYNSGARIQGGFKRSSQHRLCSLMATTRQALLPAFS